MTNDVLESMSRAPTENQLQFPAYVDTACAKSVMGCSEAMEIMTCCDKHGWPYATVPEAEPYKFGPGDRIVSKFAMIFPVRWANVIVVVRISVISQRIPILLSKYLFKKLGAVLDLADNEVTFKPFKGKKENLHDLDSGHVAIELIKSGEPPPKVHETLGSSAKMELK